MKESATKVNNHACRSVAPILNENCYAMTFEGN
jgi:hypothetical protein